MRHSKRALLALAWAILAVSGARAEDKAAREVLDRGITAQGGEAALAKFPAYTVKLKGTFHGLGAAVDIAGELAMQGPDQQKVVIETEAGGQKLRISHVLNRDKGWVQFNDQTTEMAGAELTEAKKVAYCEWVSTLIPIKAPAFTLAIVGEAQIDNRAAMGVTASSPNHRDVNLFFDRESGLLVKTEKRVKDETSGQEVTEEAFLREYKTVQGMKQATKFTIKRDGKLHSEGELSDYQFTEKLDDAVFAKP